MFKKTIFIFVMAAALIVLPGCEDPADPLEPVDPDEVTEPEEVELPDQLPAEIELWIEQSKERFAAQALEHEEILYLLVTYGEKPTAGYAVEITEIKEDEDKVVVTVHFTEPAEDEMVAQVITYPFDLAMIDDPGLPVEFNATGAETEIPVQE